MSLLPGPHRLRLVPLGGLGEIGMNCLAIEQDEGIVVIDCGAGFPDDDRGIDVYHPDFSWLLARKQRVSGVFLTHGHEDHIGALPYLLNDFDVPVWGPPHALGLVRRRLAEHDFEVDELDLREAHAGERYDVGPFVIEPIRVAHSIVEATALAITTAAGRVVHTGDFNLDPDPPDGEPTDEARLAALGDEGVALLLSDSTNSDVRERPGSERSVATRVEELVAQAEKRVVIALFASNVQRLITFGEMAQRLGRKICLLGRSLENQFSVATQIGRVHWPSDLLISPEQVKSMPREAVLILCGGTQAEKNSALRRLASAAHPYVTLEPGDTVLFSSRVIPGNERPVIAMLNDLLRAGLIVHSRMNEPAIHTSGHAGQSEQRRMLELVRPRCFLPVHGTLHHLLRHESLGRSLGIRETLVVENGAPVVFDGQSFEVEPQVRHGKVPIAFGGEQLQEGTLRARGDLARFGVAFVCLVFEANGNLASTPLVTARGIPSVDDDAVALRTVALEVARAAANFREGRSLGLQDFVKRTARRKLEALSGTRPLVEVSVVQL